VKLEALFCCECCHTTILLASVTKKKSFCCHIIAKPSIKKTLLTKLDLHSCHRPHYLHS
jgi:hypothetical protein